MKQVTVSPHPDHPGHGRAVFEPGGARIAFADVIGARPGTRLVALDEAGKVLRDLPPCPNWRIVEVTTEGGRTEFRVMECERYCPGSEPFEDEYRDYCEYDLGLFDDEEEGEDG